MTRLLGPSLTTVVLALCAVSCRQAPAPAPTKSAAHPSWAELAALFGREKTSPEVRAFVAERQLGETTKGPSGMFSPRDNAYTLMYSRNLIETIVIHVQPWPEGYGESHWSPYRGKLPFGLRVTDRREEVLRRLGPPTQKNGETWHCRGLSVCALFRKADGAIESLYISPIERPSAKLPPLPDDWRNQPPINAPYVTPPGTETEEVELVPGR